MTPPPPPPPPPPLSTMPLESTFDMPMIYLVDLQILLYTDQAVRLKVLEKKNFLSFSPLLDNGSFLPQGYGQFGPHGHSCHGLCRGPLDMAIC